MRNAVVHFAFDHRSDEPTLFLENSEPRDIADMIRGDCNSRHGNDVIIGGGAFRSVNEYFQACDHVHYRLSRN